MSSIHCNVDRRSFFLIMLESIALIYKQLQGILEKIESETSKTRQEKTGKLHHTNANTVIGE